MINRKVWQFIGLTYLISWTAALIMYLSGVQYGSFLSTALIALLYMPGPAFATLILQKLIYKQSLRKYGLVFNKEAFKYAGLAILALWAIIFLTLGIIYIGGNLLQVAGFGTVNFNMESVLTQLQRLTQSLPGGTDTPVESLPFPPVIFFVLMLIQGSIAGAIVNFPFALGEELGWRGMLQKETESLGFLKSNLFIGLMWGIWHAPIIAQGHNYPGHPAAGIAMMTLFTIALSFLFGYFRQKSGSVVAPTVFHGALNAVGVGLVIFIAGANPLLGSFAGLAGIMAITIVTLLVLRLGKAR